MRGLLRRRPYIDIQLLRGRDLPDGFIGQPNPFVVFLVVNIYGQVTAATRYRTSLNIRSGIEYDTTGKPMFIDTTVHIYQQCHTNRHDRCLSIPPQILPGCSTCAYRYGSKNGKNRTAWPPAEFDELLWTRLSDGQ